MEHHVCKGTCGAVSEYPGTCSTEDCTYKGQAFEECGCGDMSSHKQEGGESHDDNEAMPSDSE